MTKRFLLSGILAMTFYLGYLVSPSHEKTPRVRPDAVQTPRESETPAPTVFLEHRVRDIQSQSPPARRDAPAPAAGPEAPAEDDNSVFEQQEVTLTQRFEADAPGTVESHRIEGVVRDAFSGPAGDGTKVESSDCRATTCRVTVVFASHEADLQVMRRLLIDPGGPLNLNMDVTVPARTVRADGTVEATLFMTTPAPIAKAE